MERSQKNEHAGQSEPSQPVQMVTSCRALDCYATTTGGRGDHPKK